MCFCENIDFGSYDMQVSMKFKDKWVCIDLCLATEIALIWKNWIKTIECCCGHNKLEWYIAVQEINIEKMREMWYKKHINKNFPEMENFFVPKYLIPNQP